VATSLKLLAAGFFLSKNTVSRSCFFFDACALERQNGLGVGETIPLLLDQYAIVVSLLVATRHQRHVIGPTESRQ